MLRRAHQSVGQPLSMFRIVLIHDEPSRVRIHYHQHLSYVLGGIQMLMGILCIVTVVAIKDQCAHCVEGFLGVAGVPFFVTGVLCVAAARHRKSCSFILSLMHTYMLLSSINYVHGVVSDAVHHGCNHCHNWGMSEHFERVPRGAQVDKSFMVVIVDKFGVILIILSYSVKKMNIVLIIVVVVDGLVASASIWIGGLSMSGKRQPSSSAAMVAHPASEGTTTHPMGDVHGVLPPCQMSSPTVTGHQSTVPAYGDISPGFQSQHIEKPESVISPTPPRYTPLSEPPPAYTDTVVTAPSSGQSV